MMLKHISVFVDEARERDANLPSVWKHRSIFKRKTPNKTRCLNFFSLFVQANISLYKKNPFIFPKSFDWKQEMCDFFRLFLVLFASLLEFPIFFFYSFFPLFWSVWTWNWKLWMSGIPCGWMRLLHMNASFVK